MQIFTQPVAKTISETVVKREPTIDSISITPTAVNELPLSASVLTEFPLDELKALLQKIDARLTTIEALLQPQETETTVDVENTNTPDETGTETLESQPTE